MLACASSQVAPSVVINGSAFSNVTVFTQLINSSYLALVTGATYYVSVRATAGGPQGLSATATSNAVEVNVLLCATRMGRPASVWKAPARNCRPAFYGVLRIIGMSSGGDVWGAQQACGAPALKRST